MINASAPPSLELILGRMPDDADCQRVLAMGPWCFAEREERFPGWEKNFLFAPEPLSDEKVLQLAIRQTRALSCALLPRIAENLSPQSDRLPESYWETLLMPWLGLVAQQVVERWLRIQALFKTFAQTELTISVLPCDCRFSFAKEQDVTLHAALGIEVNHWLFSWLLTHSARPEAWTLQTLPVLEKHFGQESSPQTLKQRLRSFANRLLLSLPFPHLKGLSLWQTLRFSGALLHTSKGPDHSRSLREEADLKDLEALALPADVLPLFLALLPASLRKLTHPSCIRQTDRPRIRCASVLAYEDTAYRQRLALWRGAGHRLLYIQHGGNYGQIRYSCLTAMVEYTQHCFATWGWNHHTGEEGQFKPIPYPQLARIRNRSRPQSGLLFVGTEMPLFGYRLDAHPTPLQIIAYREAKLRFCTALGEELQKECLYRPYFPVPSSLEDGPWLLRKIPHLRLCTGPLLPHVLNCRLLVLDHHGTSLLEAMAANVPLLLYWDRKAWPMTDECETLLNAFQDIGIFHPSPEDAALFARRIWKDVTAWWQKACVQKLRQSFCHNYARVLEGSENKAIVSFLSAL